MGAKRVWNCVDYDRVLQSVGKLGKSKWLLFLHYNPTSHGHLAEKWNKFMKRYGYDEAGASYRKEL